MHSDPSFPLILKVTSVHRPTITTSLICHSISVFQSQCLVLWCFMISPAGMCMTHKLHHVSGSFPYCIIAIYNHKCRYMNWSHKRSMLYVTSVHLATNNFTVFRTQGKDTTWVDGYIPTLPNPLVWGLLNPCRRTMLCIRYEAANVMLHSKKLIPVWFRSLNFASSLVAWRLYDPR